MKIILVMLFFLGLISMFFEAYIGDIMYSILGFLIMTCALGAFLANKEMDN